MKKRPITKSEKSAQTPALTPNDALATKVSVIRSLLDRRTADDAKVMYRVAKEVAEVTASANKYGTGAVRKIAKAVGCTAPNVYAWATVADCWDESAFNALLELRNSKGRPLAFSHFVEVAREPDGEKRSRLLEKALAESLSVRDIAKQIPRSAPPKPMSLTVTVNGVLAAAEKEAAKIAQLVTSGPPLSTYDVRTSIATLEKALEVYRTTLKAVRGLKANGDKIELAAE